MSATAARLTDQLGIEANPPIIRAPLKDDAVVLAGTMAAIDASGYFVPVTAALGLRIVGLYLDSADNTNGGDGGKVVRVQQGVWKLKAGTSGDALTQANLFDDVYAIDNETVGATDGTGTRSLAGKLFQVESDGVYVRLNLETIDTDTDT